ncbi:hypothetical protein [Aeromonas veronii]|uniref:hypothetical protein n=1 Tax=Aeromonas veronii TaxID=654 RepID=UPI003D2048CE
MAMSYNPFDRLINNSVQAHKHLLDLEAQRHRLECYIKVAKLDAERAHAALQEQIKKGAE